MGGQQDVRQGSECSTTDSDYHLRNYIWMLSLNQIFLVNPCDPSFSSDWVPCREFYTLHEAVCAGSEASNSLGDMNYFPHVHAGSVLWSLRDSFSPTLLVRQALDAENRSGIDAVLKRMNLNQLQLLVSALQSPDCIFQRQVPQDEHAYVMEQALVCSAQRRQEMSDANEVQLNKMLCHGVDPKLANLFLEATASQSGLFSEFRAVNLLQVVSGSERSPELASIFGRKDYELGLAKACFQVAFYPESTLEALKILEDRPELSATDAAKEVVAKKERLTRRLFEAQGLTNKALREAQEAVEEFQVSRDCAALDNDSNERLTRFMEKLAALVQQAYSFKYATVSSIEHTQRLQNEAVEICENVKLIVARSHL